MERRDFIATVTKGATALAGGAALEGAKRIGENQEHQELDPAIQQKIRATKEHFLENKQLFKDAQQHVSGSGGWTHHEYPYHYFKEHTGNALPDNVRTYLADLMPGLVAKESQFNNDKTSPVGGSNFLQIMRSTYFDFERGATNKQWEVFKKDMKQQIDFMLRYLDERVYTYLNESTEAIPFQDVCDQFDLDDDERDRFSALATVNAYKRGQGNTMRIIKKFAEKYPSPESLPKTYNNTGLGLFYLIANAATDETFSEREPRTSRYLEPMRDYLLEIQAGNEALNEALGTSYGLSLEHESKTPPRKESLFGNTVGAGIAGVVTGIAAEAVDHTIKKNQGIPQENISRGKFFNKFITTAGAGVVGSKLIPEAQGSEVPPQPPQKHEGTHEHEHEEIQEVPGEKFPDGLIHNPEHVREKLDNFFRERNKLFPDEDFDKGIYRANRKADRKLPRRNYISSKFKIWFEEAEENKIITRYTSKGQIEKAVRESRLSSVEEMNHLWRCHNVKGGDRPYLGKNNPSYLALHEEALHTLKDIAELFQKKLVDAGLDTNQWNIRPKVESLIRDRKMPNGSDQSPHEFGLGIDFPKRRAFDLIHVADSTFMVIDQDHYPRVYQAVETLFMRTLQEIHDTDEKVIVTREKRPAHFHIAVKTK